MVELWLAVSQGEGFARPNRFMVDFILPKGVETVGEGPRNENLLFEEEIRRSTKNGELNSYSEIQRGLRAFVETIDMLWSYTRYNRLYSIWTKKDKL